MAKSPKMQSLLDTLTEDATTEDATTEDASTEEVTPEVTFEVVVEDAPLVGEVLAADEEYISPATRAEMEAGRAHVARIAAELAAAKE